MADNNSAKFNMSFPQNAMSTKVSMNVLQVEGFQNQDSRTKFRSLL